jgi:myo-inositol-1(or 4)-monophosphatase
LSALLDVAVEVAEAAGVLALEGLSAQPQIDFKGRRELVTPVDRACEELIISRVREAFPDHGYFAEEGHKTEGEHPFRWIVDPIDGTTNYAHRLPAFAISIGIEDAQGMAVGVVHAPYLQETFFGSRGGGAFFVRGPRSEGQPRRLAVSQTADLADAVLATGFAYVRNETENTNLDNWAALSMQTRGLRRVGSASLDLAYVADGRFDGFWEMHLKPYDVAAGVLLIREAGGLVTDMFGGEDWLEGQTIVATNGACHEAIRAQLASVRPDPWVRIP